MSASLSYESSSAVATDARAAILAHIESASAGYDWWCEPIHFYDNPYSPDRLTGNTKLFLLHDDPAIESFMAHADATKILDVLSSASREFGVNWNLTLEGASVGTITAGQPDTNAVESLASLLEICEMMGIDHSELNRAEILADNPDR